MRFRSLQKWENPKQVEGLVLFAQLFEELMFRYSIDSYKPRAMNSATLILEADRLITDIENKRIDKANLKHVIDELVVNLRNDTVAQKLISEQMEHFIASVQNESIDITEKKVILELMLLKLNAYDYKTELESQITQALSNPNKKELIIKLTRNYATSLISIGYSDRYILNRVIQFFYYGPQNTISDVSDVSRFFDFFKVHKYKYKAVVTANQLFGHLQDTLERIGVKYYTDLNSCEIDEEYKHQIKNQTSPSYLVFEMVEALDIFTARDEVESILEELSSAFSMFHHKEKLTWDSHAFLINTETNFAKTTKKTDSVMFNARDLRPKDAAEQLSAFLKYFKLKNNDESMRRYISAVDLHSLALGSDSSQDQLLNLWIALETLAPSKLNNNSPKIGKVIKAIVPILCLKYLDKIVDQLLIDFIKWDKRSFKAILRNVNGDNEKDKLLRLLVLNKYDGEKQKLYRKLNDFVLLRNRTDLLSRQLSSPSSIKKLLSEHSKRLEWQLRRIYRTRNQIVHVGYTPNYTGSIIRNTHYYLDNVLSSLGSISDGIYINTLDQAFKALTFEYESYLTRLKELSGSEIDEENYNQIFEGIS